MYRTWIAHVLQWGKEKPRVLWCHYSDLLCSSKKQKLTEIFSLYFPFYVFNFFGCTSNENNLFHSIYHYLFYILAGFSVAVQFYLCRPLPGSVVKRIFFTNLLLVSWGFRDIYWKCIIRFEAACREEENLGSKLQMLWAISSGNICYNLECARCRKFLLPRLGPIKWNICNFRLLLEFPEGKQLRDCCYKYFK